MQINKLLTNSTKDSKFKLVDFAIKHLELIIWNLDESNFSHNLTKIYQKNDYLLGDNSGIVNIYDISISKNHINEILI